MTVRFFYHRTVSGVPRDAQIPLTWPRATISVIRWCLRGLYWCVDIDLSNAEAGFVAVNDCLGGAYDEDAVLSSAEVAFLTDKGAKFDIVAGCWGVGAVDLRFSHRMVETKTEGGVRFYSKWFGCNLIENQGLEVWMYGDSEYAQVLQEHLGQDRLRVHMCGEDNSLLRVNFQKDSHKNRAHVNGQMLGYQRLMMFEQLAAMDVSKVLRVCVDGRSVARRDVTVPFCTIPHAPVGARRARHPKGTVRSPTRA